MKILLNYFFIGYIIQVQKGEKETDMDNKKENFKRISENRVNKILQLLGQLSNLTNTSFYEYTEEDIEKIFSTIEAESNKTKTILLNAKSKKKKKFEL